MKEFLSRSGVPYEDRDISQDEAALNELSQLGLMTTPVIRIDDQVVVGFDRRKIEILLGLQGDTGPG